jgi:hypothetical protein
MGREKRISESRAKEVANNKTKEAPRPQERSAPATPAASAAPSASVPVPKGGTSTGRAIFQILLLYLGPILLIILVGKLILRL